MATQKDTPSPKDSKSPQRVWLRQWTLATKDCRAPVRTPHSTTPRQVPERVRRSARALGVGWSLWWHSVADTASCRGVVEALWWHCHCAPGTMHREGQVPRTKAGLCRGTCQAESIWVLREDSHFGMLRCGQLVPGLVNEMENCRSDMKTYLSCSTLGPQKHKGNSVCQR